MIVLLEHLTLTLQLNYLMCSLNKNNLPIFKKLFLEAKQNGFNINMKDMGETLLHIAIRFGPLEIVNFLVFEKTSMVLM